MAGKRGEEVALFSRRVVRQAADGILCSRRRGGEQHEEQQRGCPRQEIQFNGFLHNVCMLDYNLPARLRLSEGHDARINGRA